MLSLLHRQTDINFRLLAILTVTLVPAASQTLSTHQGSAAIPDAFCSAQIARDTTSPDKASLPLKAAR
ncbi:hypothetical protein [Paraburkholderia sp. BL10I2N1]|uniref:hypothetical protein n=1 Tax=Paraburkholderia sp. BL10I2N1 TaxID=1938796 RepID=UPI00105D8DC4|nr:hypothetical protein [Paraburkholderia sp. BL10I2N1]TDN67107.1 hypothetical protein B0G77_0334 [Paraburkholderia sp. BL10I2N1]